MKLLPSADLISQQLIATLIATLGAAWIISRIPEAKALVHGNSLPRPFN